MDNSRDEHLLQQIKNGHEGAFAEIYNRYRPMLLRDAYYKVRNYQEAQDIVQEVFTTLWMNRQVTNINTSLRQYLFKAVHFKYITWLRKKETAQKFIDHSIHSTQPYTGAANTQIENRELSQQINHAIDQISAPATRKVFKMQYIKGEKPEDIAAHLQISIQVVRNQVSRALKLVRSKLKETR